MAATEEQIMRVAREIYQRQATDPEQPQRTRARRLMPCYLFTLRDPYGDADRHLAVSAPTAADARAVVDAGHIRPDGRRRAAQVVDLQCLTVDQVETVPLGPLKAKGCVYIDPPTLDRIRGPY